MQLRRHRRALAYALTAVLTVPVGIAASLVTGPSRTAAALTAPRLVADANLDGASSVPTELTEVAGRLFFIADDGAHGRELWVTDGSRPATILADINPGESGSGPGHLFGWNGVLFFTAYSPDAGIELWRSDGTPTGTYRVADIYPGPGGSSPQGFTVYANHLYFTATSSTGSELWRTNGKQTGTEQALDLRAGSASSAPSSLTVVDHGTGDPRLWMIADAEGASLPELVVYDAPEGVTSDRPQVLLTDGGVGDLAALDGDLYVAVGATTRQLTRVSQVAAGPPAVYAPSLIGGSSVGSLTVIGGRLFLTSGAGTPTGVEPHVLNGVTIELLADIGPGNAGSAPGEFLGADGDAYFTATDGLSGTELWRSDGTPAGTVRVVDAAPGSAGSFPYLLTAADGGVVFSAHGAAGRELWFARASDGTAFLLDDLFPGPESSDPHDAAVIGDALFASAHTPEHGAELYRLSLATPLTEGATEFDLAGDVRLGTADADPWGVTRVDDQVMYTAYDSATGEELRVADPMRGTAVALDLEPGPDSSTPHDAVTLGDRAVFLATTGRATELWTTDGTAAGTMPLDPDPTRDANADSLVVVGDTAYFVANVPPSGRGLWRSDGTVAGTRLVAVLPTGGGLPDPFGLAAFGQRVLFSAGGTLWISDGSAAGTGPVAAGADAPAFPSQIVTTEGGWALFAAESPSDPSHFTVWRTDGTAAGTFPLEDSPDGTVLDPFGLVVSGSRAYFTAYHPGQRAFVTDGTVAGTRALTAHDQEADTSLFAALPGGGAAFHLLDPAFGYELAVTDGTPAGTRLVDLAPGEEDSFPASFAALAGWAYFSAWTAAQGTELWRTNGHTTEPVTELIPGPLSGLSRYSESAAIGRDLYVVGDDGRTGTELWVLGEAPSAPAAPTAVAGHRAATISWNAPVASFVAPVTGYTVTASPGGATCSTTALACTISGLAAGVPHTFTVVADSAAGPSKMSHPSAPVTPYDGDSPIVPLAPARFLDTRAGHPTFDGEASGTGRVPAGAVLRVRIAGRGSVPADATGVVANLTVTAPDAPGHATLFPCTAQPPRASQLNYLPGDTLADNAVVPLAPSGEVCIYSRAEADYVLDVNGYVGPGSTFVGVDPARYLDTRTEPNATTFDGAGQGGGHVPAEQPIEVPIAGRGAVPSGAAAAFVTLTAVTPDGPGYLTAYPCGARPHASTVNYAAGEVVPNGAVVELSPTGSLCVFTKAAAHVLVDVTGYLPAGADGVQAVAPERLLDTRAGGPTVDGAYSGTPPRLGAEQTIEVQVAGRGSVPTGAVAALLNVGLVAPDAPGYATLYPCGARPTASNVNALVAGSVRANNALTLLSPTGTVCIFVKAGTDLILDATGWVD